MGFSSKNSRDRCTDFRANSLVNYLVEDLGVHLEEICSGKSTTTERRKVDIYNSLLHSHVENLEKKEIVIPSIVASLEAGNLMGICPLGYDHSGRKVRDKRRFAFKQRIEINKNGELLQEACQWKASGLYSDAQIILKLSACGLSISKQKMSQLWRNPFYFGILINGLLDELVTGNWPPLVSREDFLKVHRILEHNPSEFQRNRAEEKPPPTRLLKCNGCGCYMVGYRTNQKDLHYYRCLKCNGVSVNAFTTPRAQRNGANDLFIDFLKQYHLPKEIAPLVKLQLIKLFQHYNAGQSENDLALKVQLESVEKKLKHLKIRHRLGEIDKDTYDLTFDHLNSQIQAINAELNNLTP